MSFANNRRNNPNVGHLPNSNPYESDNDEDHEAPTSTSKRQRVKPTSTLDWLTSNQHRQHHQHQLNIKKKKDPFFMKDIFTMIVTYWLILSQFFHKLKNIVKFYKEFLLGIIARIKLKISPFCHFYDEKRELNVILIYCKWFMCFSTGAFQIPKSRK